MSEIAESKCDLKQTTLLAFIDDMFRRGSSYGLRNALQLLCCKKKKTVAGKRISVALVWQSMTTILSE